MNQLPEQCLWLPMTCSSVIFIFRCSHPLPVFQFFFLYAIFPSIECPSLAAGIENGYKHGRGSVEGSLVWFSCANGYSLEGNKYLYCDENGQWNGTTPSCLKGKLSMFFFRFKFDDDMHKR